MGVDLPRDLGTRRLPYARLIRIIEHLPETSATARARRQQRPTLDVAFFRRMEHTLRVLAWQQTKDGQKGNNVPVQVPLSGDNLSNPSRDRFYVDELMARRLERRKRELEQLKGRPAE